MKSHGARDEGFGDAHMGPIPLRGGVGTLTSADRQVILQRTGRSASVRYRQQWGERCLTVSGPAEWLTAAKDLANQMIKRNGEDGGRTEETPASSSGGPSRSEFQAMQETVNGHAHQFQSVWGYAQALTNGLDEVHGHLKRSQASNYTTQSQLEASDSEGPGSEHKKDEEELAKPTAEEDARRVDNGNEKDEDAGRTVFSESVDGHLEEEEPTILSTEKIDPESAKRESGDADADLLTADEAMGNHCCTCKRQVDEHNSLVIVRASSKVSETRRCRNCHNVRGAIQRLAVKHGNLVKDFTKVDGDRVQSFYEQFSHLRGEDLRSKLDETVTQWKTSTTRFEFDQNVEFLEEEDLKVKYADKPSTLENILRNGKRFFCPVKQKTLFGVPSTTPAPIKNKRTRKTTAAGGSGGDEPKMKASEKKKLGKKVDGTETKTVFLKDLVDKAQAYGSMIPSYVVDAATRAVEETKQAIHDARAKIDCGKGTAQPLIDAMTAEYEKVAEATARLKSQIDAAANFK
ncbi:Uncharacterized protein SCF082_LOCUS11947 [Durusdinium trenchii]|uniref:Uncharacterized protein n=1 Tax=Durusdinium trenchii TaxID=1381693 RepID=A0ABP0JGE6_9DINO